MRSFTSFVNQSFFILIIKHLGVLRGLRMATGDLSQTNKNFANNHSYFYMQNLETSDAGAGSDISGADEISDELPQIELSRRGEKDLENPRSEAPRSGNQPSIFKNYQSSNPQSLYSFPLSKNSIEKLDNLARLAA